MSSAIIPKRESGIRLPALEQVDIVELAKLEGELESGL